MTYVYSIFVPQSPVRGETGSELYIRQIYELTEFELIRLNPGFHLRSWFLQTYDWRVKNGGFFGHNYEKSSIRHQVNNNMMIISILFCFPLRFQHNKIYSKFFLWCYFSSNAA